MNGLTLTPPAVGLWVPALTPSLPLSSWVFQAERLCPGEQVLQSFLDTGSRVPPYSVHAHSVLVSVPPWTFQPPFPDTKDFKSSMCHGCLSFPCLVFPDLSKPRWFPGSPCAGVAANQPLDFGVYLLHHVKPIIVVYRALDFM